MNKFIGGVGGGSHNWDGFRVPECFLQVFRSAGHMRNLGTGSVESDESRRRGFDFFAIRERVGSKNHRRAVEFTHRVISKIDLVLVGDNVSVILRPSGSGKPMEPRVKTRSTSNGVIQSSSSSKSWCTAGASSVAFRRILRSSEPSRTRVENPPKRSMIAPAVFAQLNFVREKRLQCGSWYRIVWGSGPTFRSASSDTPLIPAEKD
jgi:hypothetical protein